MANQPFGPTERSGAPAERCASLVLTIHPAWIRGVWGAGEPAEIAIVLDEIVQAIVPAAAGGFVWDVPPHLFGRLLDVVSTATGASLLSTPADLSATRAVRWSGWALRSNGVAGAFVATGSDATALPVAFIADGHRHGAGFARRRSGGQAGDEFVFELPLTRLPTGIGGLALQPMVGSLLLPPVLNVPADAFRHVGMLEISEPWRIRGWAAGRHQAETVPLELYVDGVLAHCFLADRPREDVGALGYGDRTGFDEAVPVPLDRAVLIDVRVAGGPSLGNSPYVRPAAPRYIGYLDDADEFSANGWAIDLAMPDRPVRVEAICEGEVVGTGLAEVDRGDVMEAGLPIARCGFSLSLSRTDGRMAGRTVSLIIAGTGL